MRSGDSEDERKYGYENNSDEEEKSLERQRGKHQHTSYNEQKALSSWKLENLEAREAEYRRILHMINNYLESEIEVLKESWSPLSKFPRLGI